MARPNWCTATAFSPYSSRPLALRSVERQHHYHQNLHNFAEQIERLMMMVLLVCFGAAIAEGSIFGALNWQVILTAALILFVVRPLSGWAGFVGYPAPPAEKGAIAFFGIRGLGSFYYLALRWDRRSSSSRKSFG